jgi:hypothetical protein
MITPSPNQSLTSRWSDPLTVKIQTGAGCGLRSLIMEETNMSKGTATPESCPLPPTVRAAIEDVLSYLWSDELTHYACVPLEDLNAPHIFDSLLILDGWLRAGTPPPD